MKTFFVAALFALISALSGASIVHGADDVKPEKRRHCGQPGIPNPASPVFKTFDNVDRVAILFSIIGPSEIEEKDLPAILQRENLKKLVRDVFEERYRKLDQGIIPTNKSWCFNRKNQPVTLYDFNQEREAGEKFYDIIKDEGTLAVKFYVQYFNVAKNREDLRKTKKSEVVTMQITVKRTGYFTLSHLDFLSTPLTASIHADNDYLKPIIESFIRERIY